MRLPFGVVPKGDLFQKKRVELFNGLPYVFGITNILIAGFDELDRDHEMVDKVLKICRKASLKLNKEKCNFRCTCIPFLGSHSTRQYEP